MLNILVMLLLFGPADAVGQSQPLQKPEVITVQRDLLKKLGDVTVSVSIADVVSPSIPESTIQTEMELRLRQSGIVVDSKSGNDLVFSLDAFKDTDNAGVENGLVIYLATLQLKTLVKVVDLDNRQRFTRAAIWSTGKYGTVGRSQLSEVRQTISDMVSKFLNDFLGANPKK